MNTLNFLPRTKKRTISTFVLTTIYGISFTIFLVFINGLYYYKHLNETTRELDSFYESSKNVIDAEAKPVSKVQGHTTVLK